VDLAAKYGDPLFSANVTNPIEPYADLIRYYRDRWVFYGHDPALAVVGAGSPDPPWDWGPVVDLPAFASEGGRA